MVRMTILFSYIKFIFTGTITINEDQPRNITLGEGDILALYLIAKGPGSRYFTYEWRKVGDDTLPIAENTQNLTIRSVIPSDSGSYYCIVTNQWGNMVTSNIITVNIICKFT